MNYKRLFPFLFAFVAIHSEGSFAQDTTGLVAYWPFPCCSLKDATGNGHDGTLTNDPQCVPGIRDQAYSFSDNSIDVPYSPAFNISPDSSLTLSAWVKPMNVNGAYQALVIKGSAVWDYGLYLDVSTAFMFGSNWPNHETFSTTKAQNGVWYNVTGVYSNKNWKLYINGILEDQVNGTGVGQSSHEIAMGKKGDQFADEFTGVIDEVRLYNRALSDSEVNYLYSYVEAHKFDSSGILSLPARVQRFIADTCAPIDTMVYIADTGCTVGYLDSVWFSGSRDFQYVNSRSLPHLISPSDSLLLQYDPLDSGTDSAVLHLRYDLGSGPRDTTIVVVGTNHNAPAKLTLSTLSQTIMDEICNGKDTSIRLGLNGCGGAGGTLDSLWMSGSPAIGIASSRVFPRSLGASDSVRLQYNPSPSGNDTSYLHIRYDGGSGAKDTMVRVIGLLDSSLRSVVLSLPTSPVRVESGCTPVTIPNPLELLGCTASGGRLDSEWITGSNAITIGDMRSIPHGISNLDSIPVRYLPGGNPTDTSILHFRYTVGATTHDTTLTIIGHIENPLPPRVLTLPASPQSILTTTCGAQDSTMTIGIAGCPLGTGTIDSVWLTGSNTILVNDSRTTPRTLNESDSLRLEYNPSGAEADTTEVHIRYDLGSGARDTVIEVIGTVASPLVSAPASLHRESASAYYGAIDSLALQLDLATSINLDSLWNTVTDISGTVAFDPTVVGVVNYLPPKPWTEVSFTVHPSSFDFEIRNKTGKGQQPFDLGGALFRPRSTAVGSSWVTLSKLLLTIGKQSYALCVTENEDNHWAVKTLGEPVEGVEPEITLKDILIYPNPAENEIMIENANATEVTVELYDAIGRSLLTKTILAASNESIGLEGFPNGPYFIVTKIGGRTETKSFIKQ